VKFTVAEIGELVRGTHTADSSALEIVGVRTDSREVQPGDLFVPLIADRDGHDFIDGAISRGACAWLSARPDHRPGAINVEDPWQALQTLAASVRARLAANSAPVIGITGSSGKTSTKDLVRGVLLAHGPSGASEKSFNNEIGVPLTLLNAPDNAWAVVLEMGARGIGHITSLCALAQPTIGVVTNVGTAHLAMYSDPSGIVLAKGELIESLPSSGVAILNAEDPSSQVHAARSQARVLTFGLLHGADVTAENIEFDDVLRAQFVVQSPWGSVEVRLQARGEHQVGNALAAAGACLAAGASLEDVSSGLATDVLSPWRMEMTTTAAGLVIVNDAYNANDKSMAAGLRSLAKLRATRRVAVLGTMAELGDAAPASHAAIVALTRQLGIETLIAVNEPLYRDADHHVANSDDAFELLTTMQLGAGDAVLVKGSRVAGLESLAHRLTSESQP
jgi:UDP-N-acetylmuramoyl-tripeptide--D-alanyl-D-alanine ligase